MATWTVRVENTLLGTTRYRGRFDTAEAAAVYCDQQAERSRPFVQFTPCNGTPDNPGEPCGETRSGNN